MKYLHTGSYPYLLCLVERTGHSSFSKAGAKKKRTTIQNARKINCSLVFLNLTRKYIKS